MEAHGCRLGLTHLLSQDATCKRALITGDNDAVIRHGAACGLIKGPQVCSLLADACAKCVMAGWSLTWEVVKRCHNQHAHELAKRAATPPAP